jgi:hypothetical protein
VSIQHTALRYPVDTITQMLLLESLLFIFLHSSVTLVIKSFSRIIIGRAGGVAGLDFRWPKCLYVRFVVFLDNNDDDNNLSVNNILNNKRTLNSLRL